VDILVRSMVVTVALVAAVAAATAVHAVDRLPLLVCGLLIIVALVACLRWPVPGLVLCALTPSAVSLLGANPIPAWSAVCFLALVLTIRGLPAVLTAGVLGVSNLLGAALYAGTILPSGDPSASVAAFAVVLSSAIGSAIRGHHRYWSELERRTHDAEETRQAAVDRGIAEERLRIARDLHDSVGHQIAIVSMHLGAAEVHVHKAPDAAVTDLAHAREGVKAVLEEVQSILRVLRVRDEPSSLTPTPGNELIPDLVNAMMQAGMTVESSLVGIDVPLPQAVGAAAYRIVQESLTNAQRHGTGSVSLAVEVPGSGEGEVVIEVVNKIASSGRGADTGSGKGLVGMRERATSVGGRVEAHRDGTLYWVRAQLPTDGRRHP
jgi:Signal transduction histidine kinase